MFQAFIDSEEEHVARQKAKTPPTTQQRLAAMIKRARDIMRTDPGLNGDLDRIPQLAWLLFLKAFDDLEEQRAIEYEGDGDYDPILPEKCRWKAWADDPRLTGDKLIEFVNETLLPTLRELPARSEERGLPDVLRDVFSGVENKMRSGYQLRELLNTLAQVHFTSADDIHTMAYLYESILREVRDAAGDSGEFYTPRPVIRFIVQQIDPKVGETVLDPACGTGGFLVETLEHVRPTAKSVHDRNRLELAVRGIEKKSQPYLLAVMNLLLHEVEMPGVTLGNALSLLQGDKSPSSQVDVVMTNPPFGGEESKEVISAFPEKYRTKETAWLFLTAVLDKLKPGGRCGMVVPNGVLFADDGTPRRIKERLLTECDLHTIVRLPDGVFAPYTDIPTNLLFFEKGRPTSEVWFYEIPPPEGRKKYTKMRPIAFEAFADCIAWWGGPKREGRVGNDRAWKVPAAEIAERGYNLDLRNPNVPDDLAHRSPEELIKELIATEEEILSLLHDLQNGLEAGQ